MGRELVLRDPELVFADLLRRLWAEGKVVRLSLSDRCDNVRVNDEGARVLEGRVTKVAASGAFCVVAGRHIPLSEVVAVARRHITNVPASSAREAGRTE